MNEGRIRPPAGSLPPQGFLVTAKLCVGGELVGFNWSFTTTNSAEAVSKSYCFTSTGLKKVLWRLVLTVPGFEAVAAPISILVPAGFT